MKMLSAKLIAVLVAIYPLTIAVADENGATTDGVFAVHLNLKAFRHTDLGNRMLEAVKDLAAEEISSDNGDEVLEQLEQTLGFDPIEELQGITIAGTDFESPERNLKMVLQLQKTSGNLEGLLLALPGYESYKHGDHVIHTVAPEDADRIYGSIHEKNSGEKQIFVATDRDDVESMLDRAVQSDSDHVLASEIGQELYQRDAFAAIRLRELPIDELDLEGPPANIAKLLNGLGLILSNDNDQCRIDISMSTKNEREAEQLQQLAQGIVAMIGLARAEDQEDEELERIHELLQNLKVQREGTDVEIQLSVPNQVLLEFLREEADLPL